MSFILKRCMAVARVESLQLLADRAALFLIFILPIFQILLFAYIGRAAHARSVRRGRPGWTIRRALCGPLRAPPSGFVEMPCSVTAAPREPTTPIVEL